MMDEKIAKLKSYSIYLLYLASCLLCFNYMYFLFSVSIPVYSLYLLYLASCFLLFFFFFLAISFLCSSTVFFFFFFFFLPTFEIREGILRNQKYLTIFG